MRLWTRIRQASSQAVSEMSSQLASRISLKVRLGRRRLVAPDPDIGLIRDLVANGTPMSLASLKAALDATASVQGTKRSGADGIKSIGLPTIGSAFTIFAA